MGSEFSFPAVQIKIKSVITDHSIQYLFNTSDIRNYVNVAGLTPELTGAHEPPKPSKFSMKAKLIPLRLNELLDRMRAFRQPRLFTRRHQFINPITRDKPHNKLDL